MSPPDIADYVKHLPTCDAWRDRPCSCGAAQALDEARHANAEVVAELTDERDRLAAAAADDATSLDGLADELADCKRRRAEAVGTIAAQDEQLKQLAVEMENRSRATKQIQKERDDLVEQLNAVQAAHDELEDAAEKAEAERDRLAAQLADVTTGGPDAFSESVRQVLADGDIGSLQKVERIGQLVDALEHGDDDRPDED